MKHYITLTLAVAIATTAMAQSFSKLQKQANEGNTKAMIEVGLCHLVGYQTPVDSAAAMTMLQQAASKGNPDAKAYMAQLMLQYKPDTTAALNMLNQAESEGSAYAKVVKAQFMSTGTGYERNFSEQRRLVEEAYAAGCKQAASHLAHNHLYGSDSCEFDPDKALVYLKQIPEGVWSRKYTYMFDYYRMRGDMKQAIQWAQKGAELCDIYSCLDLAACKFYGNGMPKDEQAAIRDIEALRTRYGNRGHIVRPYVFYHTAATDSTLQDTALYRRLLESVNGGNAMYNHVLLAQSYLQGTFTPVDTAKALELLHNAAQKDCEEAMTTLAWFYGRQNDYQKALFWANKAMSMASPDGFVYVTNLYASNLLGTPDYNKAYRYAAEAGRLGNMEYMVEAGKLAMFNGDTATGRKHFQRAIELGYTDAYVNLAYLEQEIGNSKWTKYLEQGGKKGSASCYVELGRLYENGNLGVKQDYKRAADCYRRANSAEGDYELGGMYLAGTIGKETEADYRMGFNLIKSAADQGYISAMFDLSRLYLSGMGCTQRPDSTIYLLTKLADEGNGKAMCYLADLSEAGVNAPADTAKALEYYERAGRAGYGPGYAYVGDYYMHGTFVEPDTAKAIHYYTLAADTNLDVIYTLDLANCMLRGIGMPADTAGALPLFRIAAENGKYSAMSALADYYNFGWAGVPHNIDTALMLYQAASHGDDPRGDYMIGAYLYSNESYSNAIEFLASAARNGNADAYLLLAKAVLNGNGIDADPEQAYAMLQNIAPYITTGEAHALIGAMHYLGYGCQQDYQAALAYLDTAASMGNAKAMINIGAMYAEGAGVEIDTATTLQWYERAAATGNTEALVRLGRAYQNGDLGVKDPKRAVELYQRAADMGNTDAICLLGICYEEGDGVVLNSRRAFELYTQAAEAGSSWGMMLVAISYINGMYVDEDMQKAAEWSLKGAEAGSAKCAYYIGLMYASGEGVKKNKKEARKWLTIADEAGIEAATEALKKL